MHDAPVPGSHRLGHDRVPSLTHGVGELIGKVSKLAFPPLPIPTEIHVEHLAAATLLGDDPGCQMLERIQTFSIPADQFLLESLALDDHVNVLRAKLRLHSSREAHPLQNVRCHPPRELERVARTPAHPHPSE